MPINPNELRTVEDLRTTLNGLSDLLDQLDELKEKETELTRRRKQAEGLVEELGAEFHAILQGEQRKADKLRDQIQEPKDQLRKIKSYGTGYSSVMEDKIKALEAQIEGNAGFEKKRSDMLSKPVKLDRKRTEEAETLLSGIRNRCAEHDRERARLHTEIIHEANKLAEDARTMSRFQHTNFPDLSTDDLDRRMTEFTSGIFLRG